MKAILSLAVLSALVSCGPAPKLERRPVSFTNQEKLAEGTINLDSKSVADVFKIKYENKVFLKCTLNVKAGGEVVEHVMKANLVETPFCAKSMNARVNNHKIEIDIQTSNFTVFGSVKHTDPLGTKYQMSHTPVASIMVNWTDTDETGVVLTGSTSMSLYENVPDLFVVDMTDKGVTKNFRCGLSATSVKEYLNEWEITDTAPVIDAPAISESENNPAETSVDPTPAVETEPTPEAAPEATPVFVVE